MSKRRTGCLPLVWVCLLSSSIGVAEAKRRNEHPPTTVDSVEVPTEYGPMVFRNLSVRESLMGGQLTGTVTNSIQRAWKTAYFKVILYDKAGRPLNDNPNSEVLIKNFSRGETRPVTGLSGQSPADIITFARSRVANFKILFDRNSFIDARYVIALVKPKGAGDLTFEDESVRVVFSVEQDQIGFAFQNKTATAINIDWNQIAYIDPLGGSHRVIHQEVRYANSGEVMAPTVVPPTARVTDLIYPSDYVRWGEVPHDWTRRSLLAERDQDKHVGESFSAFMPLEINGQKKEYLSTFKITDVSF